MDEQQKLNPFVKWTRMYTDCKKFIKNLYLTVYPCESVFIRGSNSFLR